MALGAFVYFCISFVVFLFVIPLIARPIYNHLLTAEEGGDGFCDVCEHSADYRLTMKRITAGRAETVEVHEFCRTHARMYVLLNRPRQEDIPSELQPWQWYRHKGMPFTFLAMGVITGIMALFRLTYFLVKKE